MWTVPMTEGEHVSCPGFRSGVYLSVTPALLLLLHRVHQDNLAESREESIDVRQRRYITAVKDVWEVPDQIHHTQPWMFFQRVPKRYYAPCMLASISITYTDCVRTATWHLEELVLYTQCSCWVLQWSLGVLCEAQAGVTRDAPRLCLAQYYDPRGTAWRKAFTVCRSWRLPGSVPGRASTRCLCMLPLASTHSGPVR